MTSTCTSESGISLGMAHAGAQFGSVYSASSSVDIGFTMLSRPANMLPSIADAGRIGIGAACRPVTRPAPANTLPSIADAGRIGIGAACRPVTRPAPANTLPSVADAGRISIGAACRPVRH